jgi:hypothetical protein
VQLGDCAAGNAGHGSTRKKESRNDVGSMRPYWIILPLRGLRLTDTGEPGTGLFCKGWCLVGDAQFDLLAKVCRDNSSLSGNIEMLRRRLQPDSILLVEYTGELDVWRVFEAYDDAETVVGALNILSLLEERPTSQWSGYDPAPIFRARYIEHCDLPLVIDSERLWMSGHSTGIRWLTIGPNGVGSRPSETLLALAKKAPPVVQRALGRETQPNELQAELELAMRALTAAFQATTLGQFIASAMSSLESLLGDKWGQRQARLHRMLPSVYHSRLEEILLARHEFVHAARQPARDRGFLGLSALALVVQVWTVIARMPQRYAIREDLWYRLRAFDTGDSFAVQHPGPDQDLTWVHKYLVPSRPKEWPQLGC